MVLSMIEAFVLHLREGFFAVLETEGKRVCSLAFKLTHKAVTQRPLSLGRQPVYIFHLLSLKKKNRQDFLLN